MQRFLLVGLGTIEGGDEDQYDGESEEDEDAEFSSLIQANFLGLWMLLRFFFQVYGTPRIEKERQRKITKQRCLTGFEG